MDNKLHPKYILRYFLRGITIFIFFLALKLLTQFSTYSFYTRNKLIFAEFPVWGISLIVIIALPLIYNSLVHIFGKYDSVSAEKIFASSENAPARFSSELRVILTSPAFYSEVFWALVPILGACLLGAFSEISDLVLYERSIEPLASGALAASLLLPLLFLVHLFCTYEIRRYHRYLKNSKEERTLRSIPKMVFGAFLIAFAYPIGIPLLPFLVFAFLSLFGIVNSLTGALGIVGFLTAVILLLVLFFILSYLRAIWTRRRFWKKLCKVSKENGYHLTRNTSPYRSIFRFDRECHFSLSKGQKMYACHFITSRRCKTPLYFTAAGEAHYQYRFGTKNHHVSFEHRFLYGFEAEGEKLLILNPAPRCAFVASDGMSRELMPHDRIWDYTVFNAESLLSAMERNCLGRYNGMFE